jgi:hypothetical protein
MRRTVYPVEPFYVAQRSRAVVSCTVHGDVDEKLLAASFAAKVAEHPSQRCRIGQADGAYVLQELAEAELPGLLVRSTGPSALIDESNTPLAAGGALVRIVLLRGGDEHTLVLSVDHAVCDGFSALALFDALWRTYIALADGTFTNPPAGEGGWPTPATDRLPPRTEREIEEYLARRVERTRRSPVVALPYEAAADRPERGSLVAVERVLLNTEQTRGLLRFAKAHAVSVQGLVGAALLIAVRRRLGGDAAPRPLGCMSPVDLRSRLTPPLGREVMVPAVAGYLDVLDVAPDTDPLTLARQVTANLHGAIERGDFVLETRILPRVVGNPALLATSVVVTNLGGLAGPPSPDGLRVTDPRIVPFREQYYPQAGRGPLMACVVSFDDRLSIELPYSTECFSGEQIAGIHRVVLAALLDFADPAEVADPAEAGANSALTAAN